MPGLAPIPDCEGPRLHPYHPSITPEIIFLEQIGQGAHGHVFKVQIHGMVFALKVFKHQIVDPNWITMDDEQWDKIDVKLVEAQWHPFHAECRAYARLKEADKEDLAARCYGYLYLTESQKTELEDRFGIDSWWADNYDPDASNPEIQQQMQQKSRVLLRATVKAYIPSDVHFGPEHANMMLEDLHQLHRAGIVVHDLKEDAYINGKLVDFSDAVVVPHIKFDLHLRGNLDDIARGAVHEDLARLSDIFAEWNDDHEHSQRIECDPFDSLDAVGRLRRGPLSRDELIARCFNPRKIKWQKFSAYHRGSVAKKRAVVGNSGHLGKKPTGVSKGKVSETKRKNRRKAVKTISATLNEACLIK